MRRLIVSAMLVAAVAAQAQAADFGTGQFKMYDEPRFEPNSFCDTYTELTLDHSDFLGNFALVASRVAITSSCDIASIPNPRFFQIFPSQVTETPCGTVQSEAYLSTWLDNATEFYTLTVWDNRTNTCEVPLPALVVMEIKNSAGNVYRLYSYDQ